jgi:hypothetical protein
MTSPLAVATIAILAASEAATAESTIDVQIDPTPFFLRGFAPEIGAGMGPHRVYLTVVAYDVPEFLREDKAFAERRDYRIGLGYEHFLRGRFSGPFVGASALWTHSTFSRADIESEMTREVGTLAATARLGWVIYPIADERFARDAGPRSLTESHRKIDLAVGDVGQCVTSHQLQLDVGMGGEQLAESRDDPARGQRLHAADAHQRRISGLARARSSTLQCGERCLHLAEICRAGGSQRERVRLAKKQCDAKLLLELLDLTTHRGRCHAELTGRELEGAPPPSRFEGVERAERG